MIRKIDEHQKQQLCSHTKQWGNTCASKRSQLTAEFVILVAVFVLFLSGLYVVFADSSQSLELSLRDVHAKRLALTLNEKVTLLTQFSNNTTMPLYLPVDLDGVNYSISVRNSTGILSIIYEGSHIVDERLITRSLVDYVGKPTGVRLINGSVSFYE